MSKSKFTFANEIELLRCDPQFPLRFIETIQKAQSFILLQNYICDSDEDTEKIFDALFAKAQEGIKVYILLDAFGSGQLNLNFLEQYVHKNFHFDLFEKLLSFKFEHFGRRLHQKVLIVDNLYTIIGGINLGKRFWNPEQENPWVDYALLIKGEEVPRILKMCQSIFSFYFPKIKNDFKTLKELPHYQTANKIRLMTAQNDWMRFKNDITKNYLRAIRGAQKEIILVASYFLPGKKLLKALAQKASKGVRVELILSGPSDVPLERWSRRYQYQWMMKKGIVIYEWDKSIVHAKIALIDDCWVTIGSYNHNFVSQYDNLEMNTFIEDQEFAKTIKQEIELLKSKSTLHDLVAWEQKRSFFIRWLEFFSYFMAGVLSFTAIALTIRKKEKPSPFFLE